MTNSWEVAAYTAADREGVVTLAPRLAVGVASWRPRDGVRAAVRRWLEESVSVTGPASGLFVARLDGQVVGVVAVSEQEHWSGQVDAYVGELVTAASFEGRGVGRALLERAEEWARDRGLARITLETGAGNSRARAFYARQGYQDEEVRLTRVLATT